MKLLLFLPFILLQTITSNLFAQTDPYLKLKSTYKNKSKIVLKGGYSVRLFQDQIKLLPKTSISIYDSTIGLKLNYKYFKNDTFYFSNNIALPYKSIFSIQSAFLGVKGASFLLAINLSCIGLFNYYTQRSYTDIRPIIWGNLFLGIPAILEMLAVAQPNEIIYLREWNVEEYSFKEGRSPNVKPKNIFEKNGY